MVIRRRLPALFGAWVRVPRPGGFLAFSSFGSDTLKELRAAWVEADQPLDVFRYTLTYSEPRKLLEEPQGLGATNADRARARGLTGKGRYQRMLAACEAMRVDGRYDCGLSFLRRSLTFRSAACCSHCIRVLDVCTLLDQRDRGSFRSWRRDAAVRRSSA